MVLMASTFVGDIPEPWDEISGLATAACVGANGYGWLGCDRLSWDSQRLFRAEIGAIAAIPLPGNQRMADLTPRLESDMTLYTSDYLEYT